MTYTVSSGTLNSTIPYHTILIFRNDLCDENIEDSDSGAREVFPALLWIVTKIHVTVLRLCHQVFDIFGRVAGRASSSQ